MGSGARWGEMGQGGGKWWGHYRCSLVHHAVIRKSITIAGEED